MTYDKRCYDLAEAFLTDNRHINTEKHRQSLAYHIQTSIEEWIESQEIEQSRHELDDHTISAHGAKYDRA